ncbi:MAG: hypothetical protein HW373_340 [Deltaproteobacteria bacterium]|jgi:hypothetical protein|nr:hypothetical protein [Deltaproteobacteria bacterium]
MSDEAIEVIEERSRYRRPCESAFVAYNPFRTRARAADFGF